MTTLIKDHAQKKVSNDTKFLKHENFNKNTKEIAVIIRAYVKKSYPCYKFSITTAPNEINISLMESPLEIYKQPTEWTDKDSNIFLNKLNANNWSKEEQ